MPYANFLSIKGKTNMKDKTVLITGSTDGIGKQAALELAKMGARIFIHGRNGKRCQHTISFLKNHGINAQMEYFCADLSDFKQVRRMADDVLNNTDRLDVLINNAGIFEKERKLSKDGFEMTFAVNHLAYFLLTGLLLDLLKDSSPARIVNVSSMAHSSNIDFTNLQGEKHYSGREAYGLSKLANILFTFSLAEILMDSNVTVNCLHPGVISTKLLHAGFSFGGDSWEEGAKTSVYLASSKEVTGISGKYFNNCRITKPAAVSNDKSIQEKLWDISEKLCGFVYQV